MTQQLVGDSRTPNRIAVLLISAILLAPPVWPLDRAAVRSKDVLSAWQKYKSSQKELPDKESGLMKLREAIWDEPPPPPSKFDRSDWKHWIDEDGDCQDTRDEVLIRDNVGRLRFLKTASGKKCQVTRGTWVCPHTDYEFDTPDELDVDHIVPLEHAWRHGGFKWSAQRRQAFANDLDNVEAVYAKSNRSKGRLGITEWLPCQEEYHSDYVERWLSIKRKYGLYITTQEKKIAKTLREGGSPGTTSTRPTWCDEEDEDAD